MPDGVEIQIPRKIGKNSFCETQSAKNPKPGMTDSPNKLFPDVPSDGLMPAPVAVNLLLFFLYLVLSLDVLISVYENKRMRQCLP